MQLATCTSWGGFAVAFKRTQLSWLCRMLCAVVTYNPNFYTVSPYSTKPSSVQLELKKTKSQSVDIRTFALLCTVYWCCAVLVASASPSNRRWSHCFACSLWLVNTVRLGYSVSWYVLVACVVVFTRSAKRKTHPVFSTRPACVCFFASVSSLSVSSQMSRSLCRLWILCIGRWVRRLAVSSTERPGSLCDMPCLACFSVHF